MEDAMISDKTTGSNEDRGVAESEIAATALINSVIEETKQGIVPAAVANLRWVSLP